MIATGASILVSTMHPFAVLAIGLLAGVCVGGVAGFVLAEKFDARHVA